LAELSVKRPTIRDVARATGVSVSAVSLALNGRPGVSDGTRARVLDAAARVGWHPSSAARALRGLGAETVGLVLARRPELLGVEPYFMRLVAGLTADLGPAGIGLVLEVVGDDPARELELYPRWWSQGRVDGVFLVDLRPADPRVPLLRELGMPAVMLSRPRAEPALPAVWIDDAAAMRAVVARLAELGHGRIGHVGGVPGFVQTIERAEAFGAATRAAGVTGCAAGPTDYGAAEGDAATEALLSAPAPPTAIVYDNDVMAVSALRVARRRGLRVPTDLSIVAWDDSPLCEHSEPPVTAVHVDVTGLGAASAALLRRAIAGDRAAGGPHPAPVLTERGTTGPAPSAGRA
jgi:DNA-binding LacI/PurR family transcriptional regulator